MNEGSGPPHVICFLISVIILHTRINRNRQFFLLLLLLLRQPFFGFDGPKPLFFFLEVKSSIQLGLNRKILIQLKLKHFCFPGRIFLSYCSLLLQSWDKFQNKTLFPSEKTNRFSYFENVKICLLCRCQNHLLNFTSIGKKFGWSKAVLFFAARKVCALEFHPNLQKAAFIHIIPEHPGNHGCKASPNTFIWWEGHL